MLTLGIESSGRQASVALLRDAKVIAQVALDKAGQRHAQTLVAEIDRVFRQANSRPSECDLFAVSVGPGSFTGLRIGVVCAKTLAYATGRPLVGIDTFQAIAENAPTDVDDVWVIDDARRGEVYVGRYRRSADGVFEPIIGVEITIAAQWANSLELGACVTGPGAAVCSDLLPKHVRVLPESDWLARAETVARLGARRFVQGQRDDPWTLEPVYLRRSAAEDKADSAKTQ